MDALKKVIAIKGSQRLLAGEINATQQAISGWFRDGSAGVGADFVIPVARAVDFQVTPHDLRPDLYPHPEDGLPPELRGKVEAIPQPNLQGAS